MTFGVSFEKRSQSGSRLDLVLFDTEEEAREAAKKLVGSDSIVDVSVWKQIAVPKLETSISWEERL